MRARAVHIVCTIGPTSREPQVLRGLVEAGMNVARINFAHGNVAEHREAVSRIRAASVEVGRPVAILQDLAGPKIRLGEIAGGTATLESGARVVLACGDSKGDAARLPVPDEYLAAEARPGGPILLGDGAVELEIEEVDGSEIHCKVVVGGAISSGKGVNAPGGVSARPILAEKDLRDLELGAELGVDLVGVSYVRSEEDVASVRRCLKKLGRPSGLVAKIETKLALENLDAILARADAVMIARGDLSLEIPFERVPVEQKRIVQAAIRAGRPAITATQMLQSMVTALRPTRAEITDVANAVLDGSDAVMLSDETAIGIDPVRACRTMCRIIEATEDAYPRRPETPLEGVNEELRDLVVFSAAAVRTARECDARAIVTWSRGGIAARLLSRQRPDVPIVAPSRYEDTWRRLALPYGVRPVLCPHGRMSLPQLEREVGPVDGQSLLLMVGHSPGESRRVPWMKLVRVADMSEWAADPRE
ncbi:MAG TPA: pyruvate kinase [Myxococcota bacterium]|nr:pyruvate kinase [Myxococcota bacterium]